MAEAVEVRDRHPRPVRDPDDLIEPLLQLPRGLHVVGQDEDVVGHQGVRAVAAPGLEQVPNPLDDDPRLARPRARDDHGRPVAPLDDPLLLGGQPQTRAQSSRPRS